MYSETLLEHFRNPRRVGALDPPALTIRVENPICGDILSVSAAVHEGTIQDARFQVRGCTASIAAGAALAELLVGRDAFAVSEITAAAVEEALDGLPNESKHAARLALDAARVLHRRMTAP